MTPPLTPAALERAAKALAEACNGGQWHSHYTPAQRALWMRRVQDMREVMKQTGGQFDSGCSLEDLQRQKLKLAIDALGAYRRVMNMPNGKDVRGAVLDAAMHVLRDDDKSLS